MRENSADSPFSGARNRQSLSRTFCDNQLMELMVVIIVK
jgi:hypothetical protein